MEFDFSSAVAAAAAAASTGNGGSSQDNYKYPLVYPQAGHQLVIRPLFNPKSGQIVRLVSRHEKVACYKTYGMECPICKLQQQVKSATGHDPFGRTKSSRTRGICFAQYISSTYQIEKSNGSGILQPGDIILLMFPWSVYTQMSAIIAAAGQTPTGMEQAFSKAHTGLYIQITVSPDFKYTTTNVPYMTFPTNMTDDEFTQMLSDMDSLSEEVLPSTITPEIDQQVREYADAINRTYISPKVPNQAPPITQPVTMYEASNGGTTIASTNASTLPPTGINQQTVTPPTTLPTIPVEASPIVGDSGQPECYGHHENNSPKCICCPSEVLCISASGGN